MEVTNNEELIINIGGKTQLFNKEFVKNALKAHKIEEENKKLTFCANYNRDNEEQERDEIIERVKAKFDSRSAVGRGKYLTTLYKNNKDNYLKHLQDELMDGVGYLEKLMQIEEDITEMVLNTPNYTELGEKIAKKYKK